MKVAFRAIAVAGSALGLWIACSAPYDHIFIAGQYMAKLDCVTPGLAVDVIDGPPIDASCDAACVVEPFDGGVYITGQCAPFPLGDTINPDSGSNGLLCQKGLAAINRHDLCLDAGPSNPIMDAGAPEAADTGVKATGEAGTHPSSDAGTHDVADAGGG